MNYFKKIYRYLKLLRTFAGMSLIDQMAYPANFWLAIITKTLRLGIVVLFFSAIYSKVGSVSGWSFGGALFIFATFSLVDFVGNVTFFRNLVFWLSKRIRNGSFDFDIIKPVNVQFSAAFKTIDFMDLTSIVPILILYRYALSNMTEPLGIAGVFLYLILLTGAVIFSYSFMLVLAAVSFWTVQSTGLGRFSTGVFWMARYPTDIFSGAWKMVFNFILPIAFIATWPAKAFLGTLSWQNILYSLVFTAIFFWLANTFWNFGLKHYSSASS